MTILLTSPHIVYLLLLSKGLSFIPQPKSIDGDDIRIGLNRLRKQMCMQFDQATKPKPTPQQLSQATQSLSDDNTSDIDTTPIYEPWDTIKKFKLKNKATTK